MPTTNTNMKKPTNVRPFKRTPKIMLTTFLDKKAKTTPVTDKIVIANKNNLGYAIFSVIKKDKAIQIPTVTIDNLPYLFIPILLLQFNSINIL